MTTGIEIYDQNGKLQFNGDMLTYALRMSGTAYVENRKVGNTSPHSLMIPTTDSFPNALVALHGPDGHPAAYAGKWGNTNQKIFAVGTIPVGTAYQYFIFDRSDIIAPSNFGLEVRNASNQITFSTNHRTMRPLNMLTDTSHAATYGGRKLAFCQATFAGHSIPAGMDYYGGSPGAGGGGSGLPTPDDPGGPNTQYGWHIDGKVYGGYNADAGQTVRVASVSWDDVYIGPQPDPNQPPPRVWPINLFVIDVTNFPVGAQFF